MHRLKILVIALGLFWALPLLAQDEPAPEPTSEPIVAPNFSAPVIVDGHVLFVVRGSSALPAEERAETIVSRIIAIAEDPNARFLTFHVQDSDLGKSIFVNGTMVHVATEADSELEQMDIEVLAALHSEAIEEAIIAYRTDRSDKARVDSVIDALIWTIGFAAVCIFMVVLRKPVSERVDKMIETRFFGLQEATKDMVNGSAVRALVGYALRLAALLLIVILLYYYLSLVLLSFAETRPFAQVLITYVTDPILSIAFGFLWYLPNLLAIAVIVALSRFIIKGVRLFFENVETGAIKLQNFEKSWIWPTFNIVRVAIILVTIVVSFPYVPGSDSPAFRGLTILVGVMVSLGSNSVIANLLAGVFVIYRRSTNIGDRIKIGEHVGDVVQIKLMETHIKSIKNELVSIPNAQLLNSEVVNYSSKIDGRGLLLHTTVGIGYEEPQDKVEAMLIEAANRTVGLKKSPEPFVLWTDLADYAINYQINAYTTRGSSLPKIQSDLHRNIVNVFTENGVQIMTPSYMADPEEPKVAEREWDGKLVGKDL